MLWEEPTMTPIALQARMLQSGIAYWQAMIILQKQMMMAMTGQLHSAPEPHVEEGTEDQPAPRERRVARG